MGQGETEGAAGVTIVLPLVILTICAGIVSCAWWWPPDNDISVFPKFLNTLFGIRPDGLDDRFALIATPLCGGELLGWYATSEEAEDAQMEQYDPENLLVRRVFGGAQ